MAKRGFLAKLGVFGKELRLGLLFLVFYGRISILGFIEYDCYPRLGLLLYDC